MPNKFEVTQVDPTFVNSQSYFKATLVAPATAEVELYFGAGAPAPKGTSRQRGRYFPATQARVNGQIVVSQGSSNHVPTIDAMHDLTSGRAQEIERARLQIAEAEAVLAALGATP